MLMAKTTIYQYLSKILSIRTIKMNVYGLTVIAKYHRLKK
jgi:hypothetical protein